MLIRHIDDDFHTMCETGPRRDIAHSKSIDIRIYKPGFFPTPIQQIIAVIVCFSLPMLQREDSFCYDIYELRAKRGEKIRYIKLCSH